MNYTSVSNYKIGIWKLTSSTTYIQAICIMKEMISYIYIFGINSYIVSKSSEVTYFKLATNFNINISTDFKISTYLYFFSINARIIWKIHFKFPVAYMVD